MVCLRAASLGWGGLTGECTPVSDVSIDRTMDRPAAIPADRPAAESVATHRSPGGASARPAPKAASKASTARKASKGLLRYREDWRSLGFMATWFGLVAVQWWFVPTHVLLAVPLYLLTCLFSFKSLCPSFLSGGHPYFEDGL